jgi:hypothetical protein
MPLVRLQLRLPTREGERAKFKPVGVKKQNPLVPQFPLAEPASYI